MCIRDRNNLSHEEIQKILATERRKQIALAWSILRDPQLAEDAHQDMMLKVFENTDTFDGPRHLRDWSWKVLRNRCYEVIRKQKYQPALLDTSILDLVDDELENRPANETEDRLHALKKCMEHLTDNAQNLVRLRYIEGLSLIHI